MTEQLKQNNTPITLQNVLSIPNIISFIALLFSWAGIVILLNGHFVFSLVVELLAFVLDALDGYFARRSNSATDFGRLLDGNVDIFIYLIYPALVFFFQFKLDNVVEFLFLFLFLAAGIFRLARFSLLGYANSDKFKLAYPGMPVYLNYVLLFLVWGLAASGLPFFGITASILIFIASAFMVTNIPFPKPEKPAIYLIGIVVVAVILTYFGL